MLDSWKTWQILLASLAAWVVMIAITIYDPHRVYNRDFVDKVLMLVINLPAEVIFPILYSVIVIFWLKFPKEVTALMRERYKNPK